MPSHTSRNYLSKWLFAVALILSFVSYGGLSLPVPLRPQIAYASGTINSRTKASNSAIYYGNSLRFTAETVKLPFNTVTTDQLSTQLCKWLKVQLANHAVSFTSIPVTSFARNRNSLPDPARVALILG